MAWVRCCGGSKKTKYLFKDGTLNIGMNAYAYRPSGSTNATVAGSVSIISNLLRLTRNGGNTGYTSFITAPIDVTNLSSIVFTIDSDSNIGNFYAGVTLTNENEYVYVNKVECLTPRTGTIWSIDVSQLTGNYCLVFAERTLNTNAGFVNISEIKVE